MGRRAGEGGRRGGHGERGVGGWEGGGGEEGEELRGEVVELRDGQGSCFKLRVRYSSKMQVRVWMPRMQLSRSI